MSKRDFRTHESYVAERTTRGMLPNFLQERGFREVRDVRRDLGKTQSQTISAVAPDGERLVMRVRLCWRRTGQSLHETTYSAAQLRTRVKNDNWEGTLNAFVKRARSDGATHFLIVQREDDQITYAALVPLSELVAIWCAQRDVSKSLIAREKLARRKKNHAMNGSSPTLWLRDDNAPEVAAALWNHSGVRDLARWEITAPPDARKAGLDDTFDDMPDLDYSLFGSDGAPLIVRTRSYVKRDQRVRRVVLQRAGGKCEREGCGAARDYAGFLDVYHILGAEKSDRAWNCVAVCPNCHREAHMAPGRNQINGKLLAFAIRFKASVPTTADANGR